MRLIAVAFLLSVAPAPLLAADDALFQGRVTDAEGVGRPGVVMALVTPDGEQVYRSEPSSGSGGFRIDSAPAGDYRLVAETDTGAFATATALAVAPSVTGALAPGATASAVAVAPTPR